jgi:uncharacterized membrane protein
LHLLCVAKSQQALSATQNSAQSVENIHSNKLITLLLTKLRFGYAADKTTVQYSWGLASKRADTWFRKQEGKQINNNS